MPQPESTPTAAPRRKWLRMVVMAALAITALAIVAIVGRQTFLRNEFDITTLVDDSAGLTPSSPVLLNGIDVGHVVRVALSNSPNPLKAVRITMRFQRKILREIPEDSTAAITSGNVLGDKYINISRGSHSQRIVPGAEIRASPTQDVSTFLTSANGPLNEVNTILTHIDAIMAYVNKDEGTLGRLINTQTLQKHVTTISGDQTQLMKKMKAGEGAMMKLHEINTEIQKPLARLKTITADAHGDRGSLGKFRNDPNTPDLTAQAKGVVDEADKLIADFNAGNRTNDVIASLQKVQDHANAALARIDSGQGTLGQLLINPQLRDSLRRVTEELNSLTTDAGKHPTRFAQIRFGLF